MKIADKLRILRLRKGISQEAMAMNLGVSYGTYHSIENDKTDIRFSLLEKCAEVLEVSIIELLPDKHKIDLSE